MQSKKSINISTFIFQEQMSEQLWQIENKKKEETLLVKKHIVQIIYAA